MGHSVNSVSEGREALGVNFEVAGIDQLKGATVIRGKADGVDSAILMNSGTFARTAQTLALLSLGGLAACENKPPADLANSNLSTHQQGLTTEDLLHMGAGQQVPWSVSGRDGVANITTMNGETIIVFSHDEENFGARRLLTVRGQDVQDALLNGTPEEILGQVDADTPYSGTIYPNNNGEYRLLKGDGLLYEMGIDINDEGQLEASGDSFTPFQPDVYPGSDFSYFTSNGQPHLFYWDEATAHTRNLLSGEDVDIEITHEDDQCGLPGVDSESGLVVRSRPVRIGQSTVCRLFYAPSLEALNDQLSPIVTINNDPAMARKSLLNPRLADNILMYTVGDGEGSRTLYYALVPEYCGNDVCSEVDGEDINNCAEDCRGGIDAALVDAAAADAAQDAAAADAAQDAAAADAAQDAEADAEQDAEEVVVIPPDATPTPDAGPTPDQGVPTPDQGVPPTPDEGVPPAADEGVPPAPDEGVPPAPDQGVPPRPDQGVPPRPDQGVPPRPDQGVPPTPDEGVPPVNPQHAPYEITLETGNCVQSALKEITVGRAKFTEFEVTGDGTQICKLSLDPDGPKTEAILTISSSDHGRMKVTIQLPYDVAQNVEAEINNNSTDIRTLEDQHGGQHVNINKLGVVTAGAACDFFVDSDEPTSDGHQIFKVASFNKPDEPEIFVKFPDGTFFIPSNGKAYVVDVDTQQVLGLPKIPVCETGDENCSVTPPPGTPPTNVPPGTSPEDGGGSEGCGCSVGGRQLTGNELTSLLIALGLIGAAKPRRKRD